MHACESGPGAEALAHAAFSQTRVISRQPFTGNSVITACALAGAHGIKAAARTVRLALGLAQGVYFGALEQNKLELCCDRLHRRGHRFVHDLCNALVRDVVVLDQLLQLARNRARSNRACHVPALHRCSAQPSAALRGSPLLV